MTKIVTIYGLNFVVPAEVADALTLAKEVSSSLGDQLNAAREELRYGPSGVSKALVALSDATGLPIPALMRERLVWRVNSASAGLLRKHCPPGRSLQSSGYSIFYGVDVLIDETAPDGLGLALFQRSARYQDAAVILWGPNWEAESPKSCEVRLR